MGDCEEKKVSKKCQIRGKLHDLKEILQVGTTWLQFYVEKTHLLHLNLYDLLVLNHMHGKTTNYYMYWIFYLTANIPKLVQSRNCDLKMMYWIFLIDHLILPKLISTDNYENKAIDSCY